MCVCMYIYIYIIYIFPPLVEGLGEEQRGKVKI